MRVVGSIQVSFLPYSSPEHSTYATYLESQTHTHFLWVSRPVAFMIPLLLLHIHSTPEFSSTVPAGSAGPSRACLRVWGNCPGRYYMRANQTIATPPSQGSCLSSFILLFRAVIPPPSRTSKLSHQPQRRCASAVTLCYTMGLRRLSGPFTTSATRDPVLLWPENYGFKRSLTKQRWLVAGNGL